MIGFIKKAIKISMIIILASTPACDKSIAPTVISIERTDYFEMDVLLNRVVLAVSHQDDDLTVTISSSPIYIVGDFTVSGI